MHTSNAVAIPIDQTIITPNVVAHIAQQQHTHISASVFVAPLVNSDGVMVGRFIMRPVDRHTTMEDENDMIYATLTTLTYTPYINCGEPCEYTSASCDEALRRALRIAKMLGVFIVRL